MKPVTWLPSNPLDAAFSAPALQSLFHIPADHINKNPNDRVRVLPRIKPLTNHIPHQKTPQQKPLPPEKNSLEIHAPYSTQRPARESPKPSPRRGARAKPFKFRVVGGKNAPCDPEGKVGTGRNGTRVVTRDTCLPRRGWEAFRGCGCAPPPPERCQEIGCILVRGFFRLGGVRGGFGGLLVSVCGVVVFLGARGWSVR